MINLFTGLPGNGKTLYAITYVKEWAERENRPVFYSGITDLKLPWTEIDPEKWFDAPTGAIVVIDECQRVFRPRAQGKEPPEYVSRLETHRHQGLDIVLITQHPMLADNAIRRLTGKHLHIVRKWGTQAATVHEWPSVKDNCDKPAGRADSIKHAWKYPKSTFGLYKSAELHTVKRNVPWKFYMMFILPVLVAALGYAAYSQTRAATDGERIKGLSNTPGQTSDTVNQAPARSEPPAKTGYMNAMADVRDYTYERAPRVVGLPHTAPIYDEVTKPTVAPMPVACVSSSKGCTCYTQQGTRMDVLYDMCKSFVANGYFRDNPDKVEPPRMTPASYEAAQDARSGVVSLGTSQDGYGVLGKHGAGVRQPGVSEAPPSESKPVGPSK